MLRKQRLSDDHFGAVLVAFAIGLAVVFLAVMPWPAAAQEIIPTVAAPAAPAWWMAYVQPAVDALVAALAVAAAGVAVKAYQWLAAKIGWEADQKHESALRNTVQSAAKKMLIDLIASASGGKIVLTGTALGTAADYVAKSNPDAIEHFGKTRSDVIEMVKGALPDAMKAANLPADLDQMGVLSSTALLGVGELQPHPDAQTPLQPRPMVPGGQA